MSALNTSSSSWVRSLEYVPFVTGPISWLPGTSGFLILTSQTGTRYAYAVPSWLAGLVAAYIKRFGSPGRAYNRLVRGTRYASVKLEN